MAPNSFILRFIFYQFLLNFCFDAPFASPLFHIDNFIGAEKGSKLEGLVELRKYLFKLGYIDNSCNINDNGHFDDELASALKLYQVFFHLPVTGILDPPTVEKLQKPRCGVPDYAHHRNVTLFQHRYINIISDYTFFPGEPKWPSTKRKFTYSFPPGTRPDVRRPIKAATGEWAKVSKFTFAYTPDYDSADIRISFQVRNHGDGLPFDWPGGILAHAFAPRRGILHYDGDEDWIDGVARGKLDLQTVGMHKLGHVLGLGHSTDPTAIMYQTINYGDRKGLGKDDVEGITALCNR